MKGESNMTRTANGQEIINKGRGSGRKLVLKIVLNSWDNASRDRRELSVVRESGADVIVMATGKCQGVWDVVESFRVYRMPAKYNGNREADRKI